jgi:hypothetical protein
MNLSFTIDPDSLLCADFDGNAVWPVTNQADLAALSQLAATFGLDLRQQERVTTISRNQDRGLAVVAALNSELAAEAALYAHLTGRTSAVLGSWSELRELAPEVIVATEQQVSPDVLEAIYGDLDSSAPGLILGRTPAEVRLQVLLRSAMLCVDEAVPMRRADLFMGMSVETAASEQCRILGRGSDPALLRSTLLNETGVLTISGHADGVDADLGPSAVMCRVARQPMDLRLARAPTCHLSGFCHRLERPLTEALASVIDPGSLITRVLVFDVCWGFAPPSALVDTYFGVGHGLRWNPKIGAIICTWDLAFSEPIMISLLSALIASGAELGPALGTYLQSEKARRFKHRLCLLGDPRFRLPPLERDPREETQPPTNVWPDVLWVSSGMAPDSSAESTEQVADADAAFLRLLLGRLESWSGLPQQTRANLTPIGAALELASDAHTTDTTVNEFQVALAQLLSSFRCSPWHSWLGKISSFTFAPSDTRCALCDCRLSRYRADLQGMSNYQRYLWTCHNCGIVADSRAHTPVLLGYERGVGFKLLGGRGTRTQVAALTLTPALQSAHQNWLWPRSEGGQLMEYFHPQCAFPIGPVQFTAYILDGLDLMVATFRARFDDVTSRVHPWN